MVGKELIEDTLYLVFLKQHVNCVDQVSATYATGFRSTAACVVGGPRATEKAEKTAKAVLTRFVFFWVKFIFFLST